MRHFFLANEKPEILKVIVSGLQCVRNFNVWRHEGKEFFVYYGNENSIIIVVEKLIFINPSSNDLSNEICKIFIEKNISFRFETQEIFPPEIEVYLTRSVV